jgi:o-succinylbenzoate synthase
MLKAKLFPLELKFIKPAGTSRGVMTIKKSWILSIKDIEKDIYGFGEFSIIESLSPDWSENYISTLEEITNQIKNYDKLEELILEFKSFPSIIFGLETALSDLQNGGIRRIFDNSFYNSSLKTPINGLIWMNNKETMFQSIQDKLEDGFDCIKMKIGAIEYQDEIKLLEFIRSKFSKEKIEIRVDANGAFKPDDALQILADLNRLNIHSIEQPIKQGQIKEMAHLCSNTPTPIALDEELIGVNSKVDKIELLDRIQPQYIILKPSLHGGISGSTEWIELAEQRKIGWWMTSALESNIGLNAIAQFAASFNTKMPQGLGTGSLYHNNIDAPLTVKNGHIFYDKNKNWGIPKRFSF